MAQELNLQKFIISVVIVGIALVIGIYITSQVGTAVIANQYLSSSSVVLGNHTLWSNQTNSVYNLASLPSDSTSASCTLLAVVNASSPGKVVGAGNYTFSSTACTIRGLATGTYENISTSINFTLFYKTPDYTAAYNASQNVTSALGTGTSWISILVVVGFATIILTMLTSGLGAAGRTETPYY